MMDGWTVMEEIGHLVDAVLDSGDCGTGPTTVVNFTGDEIEIERYGAGDPYPFSDRFPQAQVAGSVRTSWSRNRCPGRVSRGA